MTDADGARISKGRVAVHFWKSAGVDRMREVVREHGCTWLGGTMNGDWADYVHAEVIVPDGQEKAKAEELDALPEVKYAERKTMSLSLM